MGGLSEQDALSLADAKRSAGESPTVNLILVYQ